MRELSWIICEWALNVIMSDLERGRQRMIGHTEEAMGPWWQRLEEGIGHRPRNASSYQNSEGSRNGFSPIASKVSTVLDFYPLKVILDF